MSQPPLITLIFCPVGGHTSPVRAEGYFSARAHQTRVIEDVEQAKELRQRGDDAPVVWGRQYPKEPRKLTNRKYSQMPFI
jgi:hypothetical protein